MSENRAQPFNSLRVSQSLCNDRCQNILYKAVFEHFIELKSIAALLLASKSFQNSSFGANFLVNFVVDQDSIGLCDTVISPSSCFSLQFVPSLHIKQSTSESEKRKRSITNFVGELVKTKYLKVSLRSLKLDYAAFEVVSIFFGNFNNEWPHLLALHLENCVLDDTVLKEISENAVNLRIVNFSNTNISFPNHLGITDSLLEHISELSGITSLNLSRCSITDAGLERVSTLSGITSLNLAGCRITDAGLERVSTLSGITSLNLACCDKITDVGLEHLSKLANITWLNLTWCDKITDTGLESVSKLSRVISLNFAGCRITDASLEIISRLSSITSLSLAGCRGITDEGFQHLAKLSDITSLNLSYCDITDAGLLLVSKLARITALDIAGRNITDADIQCITNLPNITFLNLHRSAYEATKKLATALPNCWIGHDEVWLFSDCQDDRSLPLRRPRQSVN